jgi:transcriptional regulator with XRE-family HTH domain
MGKLVSRARQLRLDYQARLGRPVPLQEVADALGLDRRTLANIESGKAQRYDADVMNRLADFYHKAGLDATNILTYNPEATRSPSLAAA